MVRQALARCFYNLYPFSLHQHVTKTAASKEPDVSQAAPNFHTTPEGTLVIRRSQRMDSEVLRQQLTEKRKHLHCCRLKVLSNTFLCTQLSSIQENKSGPTHYEMKLHAVAGL